jgi:hypothetical protein
MFFGMNVHFNKLSLHLVAIVHELMLVELQPQKLRRSSACPISKRLLWLFYLPIMNVYSLEYHRPKTRAYYIDASLPCCNELSMPEDNIQICYFSSIRVQR